MGQISYTTPQIQAQLDTVQELKDTGLTDAQLAQAIEDAAANPNAAGFMPKMLLDTSSLTNDNDHIPTSGVVKSALISQTVSSSTQPSGFYYAQWEVYRTAGLVAISFDIVYNGTTSSDWVKVGAIADARYLPQYRASGVVFDATSKAVTNMVVELNGDIKISGMTYGHEYWNTIVYLY